MTSDLPQSINPLCLAKTKDAIVGKIQLNSLTRVKAVLMNEEGELKYSLKFDFDQSGVCIIECEVETELILECQRCFKPLEFNVRNNSLLGIIGKGKEFETLAKEYEPLELDDDGVTTVEKLIEEELLLSIPLSVLHPLDKCAGTNDLDRINAEAKVRPFSGLEALIKGKD